ncbi:MAG: GNAT family N-acetyltransferase [Alphaproteobacteria bacterium]|nr:GNAT family N-acetyltransferase [Alphaproteobacteria bacterium SS10]
MSLVIREATRIDLPDLVSVYHRAWVEAYARLLPVKLLSPKLPVFSLERWEKTFHQPRTSTFVLEDMDGAMVGFGRAGPRRDVPSPMQRPVGEIQAIYLLHHAQGQGGGRQLMEAMGKRLIADGFTTGICWVLASNETAREFYEHMGGERAERRQITLGGKRLNEVSYHWPQLAEIERFETL